MLAQTEMSVVFVLCEIISKGLYNNREMADKQAKAFSYALVVHNVPQ